MRVSKPVIPDLSRREALIAMSAMTLSAAYAQPQTCPSEKGTFKGFALQLYTLREPAKADLPGTLQKVRGMGWEYVQWSGMPSLSAPEIRDALDTAGLKAVAAHSGMESFETDFDAQAAFWKTVGITDIAPGSMMSDCRDSLESWLKGAARLDAIGSRLRDEGLRLSYHNHDWEFQQFPEDPRTKFDILFEATSPQHLRAEIDVAWVHVAGVDPAACLRRYTNRCPVIHAKDHSGKRRLGRGVQFTPLGQGVLDWDALFAAGRDAGVEWYVYEQDNAEQDIFECAQESLAFLQKHLLP